jgi:hypothetical protein
LGSRSLFPLLIGEWLLVNSLTVNRIPRTGQATARGISRGYVSTGQHLR